MSRREVDEEGIRAALLSQSGAIYNERDVRRFLLEDDFCKHIGARFLCWMIQIRRLPPIRAQWTSRLYELHTQYVRLGEKLRNTELATWAVDEAWTERLFDQTGIQKHYSDDAKERIQRIVTLITLENPEIHFIEDLSQCVWVCYAVCLFFASRGGLPKSFAESMAFHMAFSIVDRVKLIRKLGDQEAMNVHFAKIDRTLEQEVPEMADIMRQSGQGAMQWAMKWELTLFSDEHTAYEVMFLWDQILARVDNMNEFIRFLCVAHMQQVSGASPSNVATVIQTNRNWDVARLVEAATGMMEDENAERVQWTCPCPFFTHLIDRFLRLLRS